MIQQTPNNILLKALATFLLGLFLFLPSQAQNKKKIVIRQADIHEYKKINGEDVAWLVGNVEYEHEGAIMNCDSSIYYRSQNRFEAFNNVRINQGDSIRMQGDKMTYDGTSKLMHITGNVWLTDGTMRLSCNEIIYDRAQNLAYYNSGGILTQDDNKLSSRLGFYNATTKRFVFQDSVRLVNPEYRIIADTLHYGSDNKTAYFFGPTEIIADSTSIYCEKGQYNTLKDIAQLTKKAIIIKSILFLIIEDLHKKS